MKQTLIIFLTLVISSSINAGGHLPGEKHKSPFSKNALIKMAKKAAPSSISENATFMDYDGTLLAKGSSDWVCMTGSTPQRIAPMCLDEEWRKWNARFMAGEKNDIENQKFCQAYMLMGDVPVDNDVPTSVGMDDHKKSAETGNFHDSGPHLMLLLPRSVLKQITSNPYAGGSYVMFPNTEWEHLMIPVKNVVPSFE
jgi:hypothetical protein